MEYKHTDMLCFKVHKERRTRKIFKVIDFQVSHKGPQVIIKLLELEKTSTVTVLISVFSPLIPQQFAKNYKFLFIKE